MKKVTPENRIGVEAINNQQQGVVDTGRRRLVFGTVAGVSVAAAESALSLLEEQAQPVYAATRKIAQFRERGKRVDQASSQPPAASSPSLDATLTTQDIPQGQPVIVPDTPTPDATVIAAQKDKMIQEDIAAQNANNWWRANLVSFLTAYASLIAVGYGAYQWFRGQRTDREKRDEDRFQTAVLSLGKDETNLGAATTLRAFLQKGQGYERFYQQIFDLAVGYLQARKVNPDNPEPTAIDRAIVRLFVDSYPSTRDMLKKQKGSKFDPQMLDASGIHLEETFLDYSDLESIWMRNAILNNAHLSHANLQRAYLKGAELKSANLSQADLSGANLKETDFGKVSDKSEATKLKEAILIGAELDKANLEGANLEGANPEEASSLQGASMWNVENYNDPQKRQKCIDKGATFDRPQSPPNTKGETS